MSTTQQIFHIFRKDVYGHRLELASLFVLNCALMITSIESWDSAVNGARSDLIDIVAAFIGFFIVVTWVILVSRVIHSDTPASQSQYWLTRPFSRTSMLLAKALFVAVFVHLQTLIVQLLILALSGVPFRLVDLLVFQLIVLAAFSLPAAIIAALTRSLVRFFLAVLVVGLIGIIAMFAGGVFDRPDALWYGTESVTRGEIWLRIVTGLPLMALIAGGALIWQYHRRDTLKIAAWSVGAAFIAAVLVFRTAPGLDSWAQTQLIGAPAVTPIIRYRPGREEFTFGNAATPISAAQRSVVVAIPLDIPDWGTIYAEAPNAVITIDAPNSDTRRASGTISMYPQDGGQWILFEVPTDYYEATRESLVRARVEFDLVGYSNTVSNRIPLDGNSEIVDGREQCGYSYDDGIVCRTGFRGQATWTNAMLMRPFASIPFAINPISKSERFINPSTTLELQASGGSLPTTIQKPESYVRVGVDIEGIRLADFNMGSRLL